MDLVEPITTGNDKAANERNLIEFSMRLGYKGKPGERGWKSFLKVRMDLKHHSNITAWIKRGVPADFDIQLRNAGIDPRIWHDIISGEIVPDGTPQNPEVQKGGDGKMVSIDKYVALLEEHNACLKKLSEKEAIISQLTAGYTDRAKGGQTQ
jgi:hypothetical protein